MLTRLKETVRDYIDQYAQCAGYLRTGGFTFRRMRDEKVFCIGRNKTGTTSIKVALSDLGYRVGNQRQAERLIRHYRDRDFGPIIEYCHTAEAFQDVPFSWPHTYIILDQVFPRSKFILTIRDPDEWFASYLRHQKQVIGTEETPTPQDLKEHPYVWKGWLYDAKIWQGRPEDKFYDEGFLKERFRRYNRNVEDYFLFKDNLLVMDVSSSNAYQKLCSFLDEEPLYQSMPWENKTR